MLCFRYRECAYSLLVCARAHAIFRVTNYESHAMFWHRERLCVWHGTKHAVATNWKLLHILFFFLLFTIHLFPNGWGMLCFSWFSPVLLPRSLSVSLIKQFICGVSRGFSRNVDIFSRSMHQNYGGKLIGLSFLTNIICLINCCSSLFI